MKWLLSLLLISLVSMLCAAPMQAADGWHKVLYAAEIANCAAGVGDAGTTYYGVRNGAHETNPLLIGHGQGGLNWGRFLGEKAAICGVPILFSFFAHKKMTDRNADLFSLAPTIVMAGYSTWATSHNIGVIRTLRANQVNAGK